VRFTISVVYPEEKGAEEVLKPGSTLSRTLTTFLPKGRSRVTDVLKAFASFKPVDLGPLEQGQIRGIRDGITDDPLQELLDDSVSGTRGVMSQALYLGTWTTVQRGAGGETAELGSTL
jgi:hypothetical protein